MENEDTKKDGKLFYTIGEVAKMFDVNTSLIRYWEKEFSIIKPKKNAKGNRLFTNKDIENFHKIYHLVKEKGMTLDGAKQQLKVNSEKNDANFEIVKSLKNIKSMLIDLKDSLEEAEK
ncbi:MAG: MerR family transcriptional regulator [Bacteroidales bacterium]|nr:MerR family transcriptional regulator [Bacteroidales bacterium]